MVRKNRSAVRCVSPDFINKEFSCTVCGGIFKVTKHTKIVLISSPNTLGCQCPYCKLLTAFKNDINAPYKARLSAFVKSQVAPIKAIEDESIRLPLAKLLDDFNALLQD